MKFVFGITEKAFQVSTKCYPYLKIELFLHFCGLVTFTHTLIYDASYLL